MSDSFDVIVIGGGPAGYPGGHPRRAARPEGRLHRRLAELRRQPGLRRHLPERRLYPLEGDAGVLRAVPPRAGGIRAHGIKTGGVELDLATPCRRARPASSSS
jgi:hypothetical protein